MLPIRQSILEEDIGQSKILAQENPDQLVIQRLLSLEKSNPEDPVLGLGDRTQLDSMLDQNERKVSGVISQLVEQKVSRMVSFAFPIKQKRSQFQNSGIPIPFTCCINSW